MSDQPNRVGNWVKNLYASAARAGASRAEWEKGLHAVESAEPLDLDFGELEFNAPPCELFAVPGATLLVTRVWAEAMGLDPDKLERA